MSRVLASDIETVGFYNTVRTKEDVHCICSIDVSTQEVFLFHDHPQYDNVEVFDEYDNQTYTIPPRKGTLEEGVQFWKSEVAKGAKLAIHNAFGFDKLILDKLWEHNNIPFDSYIDTFVQSKVQWFDRPQPKGAKSPHGLKAYGIISGINKPDIEDWTTFDAYKLHRVVEDCKIQAYTHQYLEWERGECLEMGVDFSRALELEAKYAYFTALQELRGAKVDKDHIIECLDFLDKEIENLRAEIEPTLPPTIKGNSVKVGRKEVAELLGYDSSNIKDTYIERKVDGELQTVIEKPYCKPTVATHKKQVVTTYEGFHISYGSTPLFSKLKDLREHIKTTYPNTDSKEWEKNKSVEEREVLNSHTCKHFNVEPTSDLVVGAFTRISISPSKMTQNDVVKSYLVRLGWKFAEEWNFKKDSEGQRIKVDKPTVVRYPENAAPENQMSILLKKGDYLVTTPKLDEDAYEQLPDGVGRKIATYNTYQHRRRFLSNVKDPENKGIVAYIDERGRIPCGVNNFNTSTGRSSHRVWVNPAGEKALFGKQIRQCVVAPEGKVLVGADQKSSQLSIAAFFAINSTYYNAVASGNEKDENDNYIGESAHCYSARNFGLVSEEEWQRAVTTQDPDLVKSIALRRGYSKGGSFGVIFGCSGKKLATYLKIPENEGNKKKDAFLEQMGLNDVKDTLLNVFKNRYKRRGGFYIPLPMGYWVWCKQDHKAINYIIQGTEAVAEKLAELYTAHKIKELGLQDSAFQIMSMHDENLHECNEEDAEVIGKLAEEGFTWAANKIFNWYINNPDKFPNKKPPAFKIDLAGGYEIGKNYAECH